MTSGVYQAPAPVDSDLVHTTIEYGRKVVVLPPPLVMASRAFFKASMPHRGRILRLVGGRRGPVLRDWYGVW
jgi:hypothetical protein